MRWQLAQFTLANSLKATFLKLLSSFITTHQRTRRGDLNIIINRIRISDSSQTKTVTNNDIVEPQQFILIRNDPPCNQPYTSLIPHHAVKCVIFGSPYWHYHLTSGRRPENFCSRFRRSLVCKQSAIADHRKFNDLFLYHVAVGKLRLRLRR